MAQNNRKQLILILLYLCQIGTCPPKKDHLKLTKRKSVLLSEIIESCPYFSHPFRINTRTLGKQYKL